MSLGSTVQAAVDICLVVSHAIAFFILGFCLFFHFHNHFYLHISSTYLSKLKNPLFWWKRRRERENNSCCEECVTCCGMLRSHEIEFNFYSILFTLYIILIIFVSILLCILNSQKTYEDRHSYEVYIAHHIFTDYVFGEYNALLSHDFATDITQIMITCCILSLTLAESFINYFRYFSTKAGLKYTNVRILSALKIFSLYSISYLALCAVQIFFIYWLFPIIVLMHISCNYYWISQFAKLLIMQYKSNPESMYLHYMHT